MVWVALVSLQGCAWLTAVPEEEIPFREPSSDHEGNRMANQVDGTEYNDPTMKPGKLNELPEGAATEPGTESRWNPVSRPVEPEEPDKPFKFETASGVEIKAKKTFDPYHQYPSAKDLKITEAERIKLIQEGKLEKLGQY